MIELLLLFIIVLICVAICGYTYYLFYIRKEPKNHIVSCPSLPDIPQCPSCPEIPACPEFPKIPKCNNKVKDPNELVVGFKLNTNNITIKNLIKKINRLNRLATQSYCLNQESIKRFFDKLLNKDELTYDLPCDVFLSKLKEEIAKEFDSDSLISDVLEFDLTSQIIDIAEMLVPTEICDNNTPNKTKIRILVYDIIDAFCEQDNVDLSS